MAGPAHTTGTPLVVCVRSIAEAVPITETARSTRRSLGRLTGNRLEEPDAGNLHVRICGGPGGVTRRAIPSTGLKTG
jgi:hypothetical protein